MAYPYLRNADIAALAAIDFTKLSGATAGSIFFQGATGFEQDNSKLFYNLALHRLGIGTATPESRVAIHPTADNYDEFLSLWGAGSLNNYTFYVSPGGTLAIINLLQGTVPVGILPTGQIGLVSASAVVGKSVSIRSLNPTDVTLALVKLAAQTAEAFVLYDTDATTVIAKLDIAGKAFVTNIRNAGTLSGAIIADGSGDYSSVAPSTSGNVLTSNGTTWISQAPAAAAALSVVTKTANYTVTNSDDVIILNGSSDFTITMQSVATATKKRYSFKQRGTASVTIIFNGSDTTDGSETSIILPPGGTPSEAIELIPDGGTSWLIF